MRNIAMQAKMEYDFRKELIPQMGFNAIHSALYGATKTQQVQLMSYYAAKNVGAVSSYKNLFASDDSKAVLSTSKLTNLPNAKIEADRLFLLTHIQLLWGNAANINDVVFDRLIQSVLNGTFSIKQDDRVIVPEQSCRIFDNVETLQISGHTNAAAGTAITNTLTSSGAHIIEVVPKFLFPQKEITVELNFAKALSSNDSLMIVLYGAQNTNM